MAHNLSGPTGADGRLQETRATSSYLDVLRSRPDLADRSAAQMRDRQRDRGLEVGGKQLCTVIRPRFLAANRGAHLASIAHILAALFERAGEHLLRSTTLLDRIGATELERRVWEIDPGYPGFALTSRLDSFFGGDDPIFLEYNAESPAGIGFCDELAAIFSDLPAMHEWEWDRHGGWDPARRPLLTTLLTAYRDWGGGGTPRIAVLDWDNVVTRRDFELCSEFFRADGFETIIADPRRLEYRSGAAWIGSDRINLVYRRVLLHELLDHEAEVSPLLDAYRDGAVCVVNSPRSKLLHKKTVFALLSDRALGLPVSAEEADVLDRCLPWTRFVESGETHYRGEAVDLMGLLSRGQDRFAVKPADDYGGRGVVLGWDVSEEEWLSALERGLHGGYVVQERIDVPREPYPVIEEDEVAVRDLMVDANPLLFHGEMGAILTRLSGNPLLNVTAGTGSAVPTLVLHEEA